MSLDEAQLTSLISDKAHLFTVQTHHVTALQKLRDNYVNQHYVPPGAASLLRQAGYAIDPNAPNPHGHGACKLLELLALEHVGRELPKGEPVHLVSLKDHKLRELRRPDNIADQRSNPTFTTGDVTRYRTHITEGIGSTECRSMFVHDVLHYLSPADVVAIFRASPVLHELRATLVAPPEATRSDRSLYPEFYEYSITGDVLHYAPAGDHTAAYDQPTSCLQYLSINCISDGAQRIQAHVEFSLFSHHVIRFSRTNLLPETRRHFNLPGLCDTASFPTILGTPRRPYVPTQLINGIVAAANRSKNATLRQLRARGEQICRERKIRADQPSIDLAARYGFAISNASDDVWFDPMVRSRFYHVFTRGLIIGYIRRQILGLHFLAYDRFLDAMDAKDAHIELECYTHFLSADDATTLVHTRQYRAFTYRNLVGGINAALRPMRTAATPPSWTARLYASWLVLTTLQAIGFGPLSRAAFHLMHVGSSALLSCASGWTVFVVCFLPLSALWVVMVRVIADRITSCYYHLGHLIDACRAAMLSADAVTPQRTEQFLNLSLLSISYWLWVPFQLAPFIHIFWPAFPNLPAVLADFDRRIGHFHNPLRSILVRSLENLDSVAYPITITTPSVLTWDARAAEVVQDATRGLVTTHRVRLGEPSAMRGGTTAGAVAHWLLNYDPMRVHIYIVPKNALADIKPDHRVDYRPPNRTKNLMDRIRRLADTNGAQFVLLPASGFPIQTMHIDTMVTYTPSAASYTVLVNNHTEWIQYIGQMTGRGYSVHINADHCPGYVAFITFRRPGITTRRTAPNANLLDPIHEEEDDTHEQSDINPRESTEDREDGSSIIDEGRANDRQLGNTGNANSHPCRIPGCSTHDPERSPWNICAAGHGWNGPRGGNCHLCKGKNKASAGPRPPPPGSEQQDTSTLAFTPERTALPEHESLDELPVLPHLFNPGVAHLTPTRPSDNPMCVGACEHVRVPATFTQGCFFEAVADQLTLEPNVIYCWFNNWREHSFLEMIRRNEPQTVETYGAFMAACGIRVEVRTLGSPIRRLGSDSASPRTIINMRLEGYHWVSDRRPHGQSIYEDMNERFGTHSYYQVDMAAARAYISDVKERNMGVFLTLPENRQLVDNLRSLLDQPAPQSPRVTVLLGQPGSGKSKFVKDLFVRVMQAKDNRLPRVKIVFHSKANRDKTKAELQSQLPDQKIGAYLLTPEVAVAHANADILVFDEIGKYLPGNIDTIIANHRPRHMIVTGDPLQGTFAKVHGEPRECEAFNSPMVQLAPKVNVYFDRSYRIYADYLPITDMTGPRVAFPKEVHSIGPTQRVLCFDETSAFRLRSRGHDALTVGTSQGWDGKVTDRYLLLINRAAGLSSPNDFYTAITRSAGGFDIYYHLYNDEEEDTTLDRPTTKQPFDSHDARGNWLTMQMISALRTQKWDELKRLLLIHKANSLPEALRDPLRLRAGHINDRLEAMMDVVDEMKQIDIPEIVEFEPEPETPTFDTPETAAALIESLPPGPCSEQLRLYGFDSLDDIAEYHFGLPLMRAEREVIYKGQMTSQFGDDDEGPARVIFPAHRMKDDATRTMTYDQRFVPRRRRPEIDLLEGSAGALQLTMALIKIIGTDSVPFDQELFNDCQRRAVRNMLDKGSQALNVREFKFDPTWPTNFAELFMKQQTLTKPGDINRPTAKKGQMITEFPTRVAIKLVPVFLYIIEQISRLAPPEIYMHCGKTDADLQEHVSGWNFDINSSEDDFTAWDSHVDAPFIKHQYDSLSIFNIPQELCDEFKLYKNEMTTKRGAMAFMMFSGGPDTLPFNSWANMLYQHVKYLIKPGTLQLYQGDDSATNDDPEVAPGWDQIDRLFTQVSTRVKKRYPGFCGWILHPAQVHRNPRVLLARLIFFSAKGTIAQRLPGLLADVCTITANPRLLFDLDDESSEAVRDALLLLMINCKLHRVPLKGVEKLKHEAYRHFNLAEAFNRTGMSL